MSTSETVEFETPLCRAISLILGLSFITPQKFSKFTKIYLYILAVFYYMSTKIFETGGICNEK